MPHASPFPSGEVKEGRFSCIRTLSLSSIRGILIEEPECGGYSTQGWGKSTVGWQVICKKRLFKL